MNATTLQCHSCGAAAASNAPNCGHCGARLASIACPACFGLMFLGSKFCPQCGSPAVQWERETTDWPCPACRAPMLRGTLRDIPLHECERCHGLWVDTPSFEHICRHAEEQAAALGRAQPLAGADGLGPVHYLRCPQCAELMHRLNFARCSGIIVDVCRPHGTWFDTHELRRIVHFIRAGGLDVSRAREKRELAEERRLLQAARLGTERTFSNDTTLTGNADLLSSVLQASGDILVSWLSD